MTTKPSHSFYYQFLITKNDFLKLIKLFDKKCHVTVISLYTNSSYLPVTTLIINNIQHVPSYISPRYSHRAVWNVVVVVVSQYCAVCKNNSTSDVILMWSVVYLTREYYNRDKVAGFGRFRHIFPGQKFSSHKKTRYNIPE